MSQVLEDKELDRVEEDERAFSPWLTALGAVLWGLLIEAVDGGRFSIGARALKSLALAAAYLALTVLWRFYQAGTQVRERKSSLTASREALLTR